MNKNIVCEYGEEEAGDRKADADRRAIRKITFKK